MDSTTSVSFLQFRVGRSEFFKKFSAQVFALGLYFQGSETFLYAGMIKEVLHFTHQDFLLKEFKEIIPVITMESVIAQD